MQYFDKKGSEIKAGMFLRFADGSTEKVYECSANYAENDLGINASNENYLRNNGMDSDFYREYYSLSNFDLSEVEICEPEMEQKYKTHGLSM